MATRPDCMYELEGHSVQSPSDASPFADEIVSILQSKCLEIVGLSVKEVVKGGSLGQGTTVPWEFDLDLVVYSEDIDPVTVLKDKAFMPNILKKFHELLSKELKVKMRYNRKNTTKHGIQFSMIPRDGSDDIDVDLLPSPYWSTPNEFHSFMKGLTDYQRRMFSCSAAKWQRDFFEKQPHEVKVYIKRAKIWRNTKWPTKQGGIGRPKSFLISLLVINAYSRSEKKGTRSEAQSVTDLMKNDVHRHSELHIHWPLDEAFYSEKYRSMFPSRPYIIDPANPFNNVYKSGISGYKANLPEGYYEPGDGNWTAFVDNVDSLDLRKTDGCKYSI